MTTDQPRQRPLPYPPSQVLGGLDWLGPARRYPGSGSDMHWHGWGDDDALYVAEGDGQNFGRPWNFAHLLRVTGSPPDHEVVEVTDFPELVRPDDIKKRRYVGGTVTVESRLYVAAFDYDYHDERGHHFSFVDAMSRHGGVAALMYSDDDGRTWRNVPDETTPYVLGPRFAGLAFVGFGPGYTGVPEFLEGFVYAISNDLSWESGDHIFLARVPKERLLDRDAWQFYADDADSRTSAPPTWVADEAAARPILTDIKHVGHPMMTYNPALGRFLLAFGSDSAPHSWDTPDDVAEATWHRRRELCLYEGPTPWGPWGLVHFDPSWEGGHVAYMPQTPAKWLAGDGLSGWMLFSGDYAHWRDDPQVGESFYGFMTRPFRLLPAQRD